MTPSDLDAYLTVAKKHGVYNIEIDGVKLQMVPGTIVEMQKKIEAESNKPDVSEEDLFGAADKPS